MYPTSGRSRQDRRHRRSAGFGAGRVSVPWTDSVLMPGSALFGYRELPTDSVEVGRTEDRIGWRLGPWTIQFRINKEGRFPQIEHAIPTATSIKSRLQLLPKEAEYLAGVLPKLPGSTEQQFALTIDLNGQVLVRAKSDGESRITELRLSNATASGEPVRINTNRTFLARALKLGFTEIHWATNTAPALCDDGRRQYIWALLGPDGAIAPCDDAIHIESPTIGAANSMSRLKPHKRIQTMTQPTVPIAAAANGQAATNGRAADDSHTALNGHSQRTKTHKSTRLSGAADRSSHQLAKCAPQRRAAKQRNDPYAEAAEEAEPTGGVDAQVAQGPAGRLIADRARQMSGPRTSGLFDQAWARKQSGRFHDLVRHDPLHELDEQRPGQR